MTNLQYGQLTATEYVGYGTAMWSAFHIGWTMSGVSSLSAGFSLGAGVVAGPLGWVALLGVAGIALAATAQTKLENPEKSLFDYKHDQHNCVTNGFYNFFSRIGSVAGFYNSPSASNNVVSSPARS